VWGEGGESAASPHQRFFHFYCERGRKKKGKEKRGREREERTLRDISVQIFRAQPATLAKGSRQRRKKGV